jgi:gas vesicle protein
MSQSSGAEFFAGLVVGGLVGAALAILLAPQSGEETRAQLREKSYDIKHTAEESLADTREKADSILADARVKAEGIIQDARVKAENIQAQAKETVDKVTHRDNGGLEAEA